MLIAICLFFVCLFCFCFVCCFVCCFCCFVYLFICWLVCYSLHFVACKLMINKYVNSCNCIPHVNLVPSLISGVARLLVLAGHLLALERTSHEIVWHKQDKQFFGWARAQPGPALGTPLSLIPRTTWVWGYLVSSPISVVCGSTSQFLCAGILLSGGSLAQLQTKKCRYWNTSCK